MEFSCKACKRFNGDCGNHSVDDFGHPIFDSPDNYFVEMGAKAPSCYQPKVELVKVYAVDMDATLNAEGMYFMKITGRLRCQSDDRETYQKDFYLDLSDFNTDQIGYLAGFLNAVFDKCSLLSLTGASIVRPEDINNE